MVRHEVLIVGAGNAGISLAARLLRDGAGSVTIVDSRTVHRYRPLLSYVGAGEASMEALERPMRDVIPDGCTWICDAVVAVDPRERSVRTQHGRTLHYSTLVLCPGLVEDWEATPGLREAYADGWAASTFVPESAPQVWPALESRRRGSVVFSVPPEPAPCAATALKPLLMACDQWRSAGVLDDLEIRLVLPRASVTGQPAAESTLDRAFASYGIEVLRDSRVTAVDADAHTVTVTSPASARVLHGVDLAHVVPHYRAPSWVAECGLAECGLAGESLANAGPGLVDIDPHTLRHRRYDSIWALGDAADVATRPSGGALRPQVDIAARNLAAARSGDRLVRYDGYTVMPITVSRRELMLIEVDREGAPAPSAPLVDLTRPRRSTWLFDRYVLPVLYFRRILRGKV